VCAQTLLEGCCGVTPGCFADWATAQQCGLWPDGGPVPIVYETPCDGFVAIGAGPEEFRLYDADAGDLVAFVDFGSYAACNLGPPTLRVAPRCLAGWRGAGGHPCVDEDGGRARVICPAAGP
jgi:hypothetical protein